MENSPSRCGVQPFHSPDSIVIGLRNPDYLLEHIEVDRRRQAARAKLSQLLLHEWHAKRWDQLPGREDLASHEVASWQRVNGERYRNVIGVLPHQRHGLRWELQRVSQDGSRDLQHLLRQFGGSINRSFKVNDLGVPEGGMDILGSWQAAPMDDQGA